MRIAILIPNFVEFDGGAQNARIHAEMLAEEGHDVSIFCFAADIKLKNVKLYVMGMPKSLLFERIYRLIFPIDAIKTIYWIKRLKNYQQIIAYYYPMTWLAWLAKKLYNASYTFRYSGIMAQELLPKLHERIYMRFHTLLTRLTIRNADTVISVSDFARKELKKHTGIESQIVHDLIDLNRFHPQIDYEKIRQDLNLGSSPVILSVGAIRPVKGFHLLIYAFREIQQEMPQAKLIVIGIPSFNYYAEELKAIGNDSVIFVNTVPNRLLPAYFNACDLYATCSLWETFNRPLAEAQACEKPVVAFDIGAHKEVINDRGILVEAGDVQQFAQACLKILKTTQKGLQ